MNRLSQIDTNLLVALDVLLAERHVTRAAGKMGITQSAMSQTLQRLRDTFADPLLVRSGKHMKLTPRAEALIGPLRQALQALEQVLIEDTFNPATTQREFRFACLDAHALTLVPGMYAKLARAGEQLSLETLAMNPDRIWNQMRSGEVDLSAFAILEPPSDIESAPLYRDRAVSMVREGHPMLDGRPITLEEYARWPHVGFRVTGRGS